LPRWRDEVAAKIKPFTVRDWPYSLHDDEDYDWPTASRIKMVMGQVFDHADIYELEICRDPISRVLVPGSEDEEVRVLQPQETWQIVSRLQDPKRTLLGMIAATGLRISEALALQWRHVRFEDHSIRIERTFRLSQIATTKTKSCKANVPMRPALAEFLQNWRSQGPCHRASDFGFASDKLSGKKPRTGQMVNRSYLKPATIDTGIITPGERFGFHSLRHSLSTWANLVIKDVNIAQTLRRHSKPGTTVGTYIHSVPGENLKAQKQYLVAVMKGDRPSQANVEALMKAKPTSDSLQ
jgi:integrase